MMNTIAKTFTPSLLLVILLTACGGGTKPAQELKTESALTQQTVNAVIWFNTSAENDYIFRQTFKMAQMRILEKMKSGQFNDRENSVVIDLDETVLNNSPYAIRNIKNNKTFTRESWAEWVKKGEARVLPGAAEFLRFCMENSIQVYYVSNRSQEFLEPTIKNLQRFDLPNADPEHVFLMASESDKTARRERVNSSTNVLLYIGDSLLDFDERFRDRSVDFGRKTVGDSFDEIWSDHILLPNPVYGQWENAFTYPEGATDAQKAAMKVQNTEEQGY